MIVSYEVGATFTIEDGASGTLARLGDAVGRLAEAAESAQGVFADLGRISFRRLINQMGELAEVSSRSVPTITADLATLRASLAETEGVASSLAWTMRRISGAPGRGGGDGGSGGGGGGRGGGGYGEGDHEDWSGWNSASRRDYPDARYWDGDFNSVQRSTRANAQYEDTDWNRRYDQTRREADYENRDLDAAYKQDRSEADYAERDAQLAYNKMRAEADAEDSEWNARYDQQRRMAEYENRDRDLAARRAARAAAGGGGSAGGGGGGGGGMNFHGGIRMHGGTPSFAAGGMLSGMEDIAAVGGAVGSEYLALNEQQSLFLAAQAFGIDPTSPEGAQAMARLRQSAAGAAMGTSFSEATTAAGIPLLARPLNLQGMEGINQFSGIYGTAAKAAEAVDLMRLGKFDDTLQAAVEYAHETRTYDPEGLQRQMDTLGAITMLTPHTTFGAEARTMSYVVPMARIAGIDPTDAATATGFLQQSGLRGTVAATTLRQMLVGLTRSGGPMQAHLGHHTESIGKELERGLHLEPEAAAQFKRGTGGSAHVRAMHEAGYLDAEGKPTFLNESGGMDLDKIFETFGQYTSSHTPYESEQTAYNLFGVRGQQAVELVEGATEQYGRYRSRVQGMVDTPGGFLNTQRDELSRGGMQEFGQAWRRLSDIADHLASATLPGLQAVLEGGIIPAFNALANLTAPDAEGRYSLGQQAVGWGGVAAGVTAAGIGLRAVGSRIFGGAAAGAAAEGAGTVAAMTVGSISVGSLIFGAGALAAIGGLIYSVIHGSTDGHGHMTTDAVPAYGRAFSGDGEGLGAIFNHTDRPSPAAASRAAAGLPPPPPANVSVSISGITLNGIGADIEKQVRGLFDVLSKKLAESLSHSVSQGQGSYLSPMLGTGNF